MLHCVTPQVSAASIASQVKAETLDSTQVPRWAAGAQASALSSVASRAH